MSNGRNHGVQTWLTAALRDEKAQKHSQRIPTYLGQGDTPVARIGQGEDAYLGGVELLRARAKLSEQSQDMRPILVERLTGHAAMLVHPVFKLPDQCWVFNFLSRTDWRDELLRLQKLPKQLRSEPADGMLLARAEQLPPTGGNVPGWWTNTPGAHLLWFAPK